MKNRRLLKTVVGLAIAFAMTFTPISGSYAGLDNSAGNGGKQVTESQAGDAVSEDAVTEDAVTEDAASEDTVTEDAASEDAVTEETEPSQSEMTTENSESVEQTEPEMEEFVEPEEEVAERTEYVWKDRKVKVTAVLSDAEAIPDDAELVVRAVNNKSRNYNYEAYMDALNNSTDSRYDEKNTLLYDIAFIKDGVEIQPEAGTVSVTFEFLDKQLADSIGAKKASDVNVIHLPLKDKIKDKYDTTADAKKIDADDIVVEELTKRDHDLAVSVKNEKVQFETGDFSVYAYTVDFEYTDPETGKVFTFNLAGAGSITLKDLAIILGITTKADADEFIKNVEDVKFSNENLVKVKKTLFRGWVLKSLAPFSSEELLTITMKDGTVIEVRVTDNQISSNLTNFITNAVITGATQDDDGTYHVEKNKEYSIILSFGESSNFQFDNTAELTYDIPAGINILSRQTGQMNINIVYKGRTYQVGASYDLDTSGHLIIKFDTEDPDFHHLDASTNVSFRFTYHGEFDGTNTDLLFSDVIERDVIFDEPEPAQAYVSKSGSFDKDTGIFHYTIKVTATGDVTNVNVKDVISGDALIFNNDVRVSGNSSSYTDNGASNGFDYTFASMHEGEEIIITYSARTDFTKDSDKDGKITVDQTKNTVTVKPDGGEPHKSEYSREIDFKTTSKGNGVEAGTTADGNKIIDWTVHYNQLALASAAGDTIKDSISANSAAYMKYYGDGITVKVYDHSGSLVETRNIRYDQLTAHSDSSWIYTIPSSDTTPYHYEISYQTVVDMEKVNGGGVAVALDNTANGHGGGVNVTPESEIGVVKNYESYTTEEVNWVAELSVPKNGLTQAVVTDTLPGVWLNGAQHYDIFKDGTLDIQGLLPGESYSHEVKYENNTGKVIITFYKDAAKTQPGLQAKDGGHTITVRLTTKVDQEWLQKGYEAGRWWQDHTNTIDFNGKTDEAKVIFGKPGIDKKGTALGGGSFMYTVVLSGVSDLPVSVKDTFDTSLLELDTSKAGTWNHMKVWGGNQYSQDDGPMPIGYTDADDGIVLTANSLPMQADGSYYPYYKICYYLKLKDGVDLEQLAIANGGEYDLINTAKWGDHESKFTYETKYDYLDKKLLNAGEIGGTNRKAKYQITFNKAKATLHGGEPMEMKDVLSANLSVDYSSISIVTDPEGVPVPYSLSGGKDENGNPDGTTVATYTVPDSTKVVITYDAEVRGNRTQRIVNKVSVNGEEETVETTKSYGSASEGQGAQASFKIVKVDGYDASKKLKGVKFKVFAENPNIDFGGVDHKKEIVLTTDENGEIVFDGNEYEFYFNEPYHVQEVEPLENYGTISFDYLVTLTNDMAQVDYGHYLYYYSDVMQIKNWPLEGLIVEKQVESDSSADKDRYYNFKLSILKDDGTVNTDYNEKNGDDTFVNGVVEFRLKDKEQKMFWGFQKGTKYKVEEIDDGGLATEIGYDTFDEGGNVIEHKTETAKSHTGELTQEDEVIVFKNSKHNEKGSLKLKKNVTVNGNATTGPLADGDYTFTIAGTGDNSSVSKTVVITIENGATKSATIDSEAAQVGDDGYVEVKDLEPGDYTITETTPTNGTSLTEAEGGKSVSDNKVVTVTVVAGETADAVKAAGKASFTNNRTAEGKGEIKVKKTLNGREWTNDDIFTFTLSAEEGTPMPGTTEITIKKSDADQTKSFGEIQFTEEGTYTYKVKETKGTLGGVTYDETEHTVTIKVKDNGEGKLVADGTPLIQTEKFTNTYETKGNGEIKVQKVLNGREWTDDDQFTFTLSAEEGTPMPGTTEITIKKSDADQTKTFGEIKFTKAGTYTYKVKETKGTLGGVTYDETEHTVTIKVKDNGEGKLVADGTPLIQTEKFTNTYETKGNGEIKVQKVLNGREWTDDDQFTFTLSAEEGTPMPGTTEITIKKSDADQTKTFGEIKFTKAGTYTYKVKETKGTLGGVTYDETEHTVTIKVKDNGEGKLVADGTPLIQTEKFTNTYETKGNGEIKVQKVLNGREWTDDDQFTFTLSAEEGTPMPGTTEITIKKSDADQTKTFGEIKFTKAGTYTYKVKETKGTLGGVTYDETEHTVTIKVKDNGEGKLVADGTPLIQTEKFTNTYETKGNGEIKVQKVLNGREWTDDDQFTFTLSAEEGTPMPGTTEITIKKSDADQTKTFGEIKFTKAGTYTYKVKETKGTLGGVTYDETEHTVTIKVKDNGEGKLVADGTPLIQTEKFTNTYETKGNGEIKVQKVLNGREWTDDDQFTFTLSAEEGTPMPGTTEITIKKSDADQTKTFGEIKFTKAGTYTYKVKETKGTLGGVTYDETEHTVTIKVKDNGEGKLVADGTPLIQTEKFTNTYETKGNGEIKVQKVLNGREWTDDDQFTFTLSAEEGTPMPGTTEITIKKSDADQTKTFGEIKFTKAGTYTYKVKETKGTLGGVTYDETEHTVTIKVKDNGEGKLVADGTPLIQTEKFTNTYETKGNGEIKVQKVLNGREWTDDDQFTFTLSAEEGTPMPGTTEITIKKSDADQTKTFGEIKFTKAGTYTYKVKETKGTLGGVTYDETEHTVTIKVKDNGEGKLVADGTPLIQTEKFTNTYETKGNGEIKVQKVLNGREWTDDDQFTFTLSAEEGTPMPGTTEITIKKSDADQTKTFGEIKFTKAGTYTYKVKETKGTLGGVTYDETEHTVTIKVKDNGEGKLVADGTPLIQTEKFTNTYETKGNGEIKVQKVLNGREWTDDDQFTFTLSAEEGTPMPGTTEITIKKSDADQTKTFGEIKFTKAGTYTYKVKETKGTLGGVTYDETEHTVTIKVKDNGEGKLVADGTPLIQTEKFTNTYETKGNGEIKVQKTLSGREWKTNDSFEFTITPVGDAPKFKTNKVTVTKDSANYTESFGKVKFTEEGTYQWTVTEEHKGETIKGVAYDSADKTVTIVVKDDGKGHLIAEEGSALVKTAEFTNTYSKAGEGEVKVQKTLNGREWKTNDSFEFTITPVGDAPKFKTNKVTVTKDSANYTESFGKVKFTEEGTYQWTVTEEHKGETIKGVKYDTEDKTVTIVVKDDGEGNLIAEEGSALVQTAAFTNEYSAKGKGEVKVKKTLSGRDWTTNDSFEFTITPVGDAPKFKTNKVTVTKDSADYTESFGEVEFTKVGTYQWTVSETHQGETIKGVAYDSADKTVTIVVKDDGEGNLIAEEGSALIQTAPFENTYSASGKGEVKVKKTLSGREWTTNDSFEFTIAPVGDAPAFTPNTVTVTKNSADYTESFGEVEFTKDGTYTWKVTETHKGEKLKGITYDSEDKIVTIVVKDDGEGHLIAEEGSALIQTAEFTNTYDAKGSIPLKGTKKFKHGSFDDEEFTFGVYTEDDVVKAVDPGLFSRERERNSHDFIEDLKDAKVLTASTADAQVGEDGTAAFDFKTADGKDLEYTLADIRDGDKTEDGYLTKTFKYVVMEDIPETAVKKTVGDETFYYDSEKDIKYDATVYPLTITVTDKGDGTLDVKTSNGVVTFGFENEVLYTKLLLTKNIDSLVTGDTEGELTNVTCVFKVTYTDPLLGRTVSRTVSVQFDAAKVAAETATVDKIPIDATDLKVDEVYAADYEGTTKGVAIEGVDPDTGLPLWTAKFDNKRKGDITGGGVINKVEKADNTDSFVITNRRDSTKSQQSGR